MSGQEELCAVPVTNTSPDAGLMALVFSALARWPSERVSTPQVHLERVAGDRDSGCCLGPVRP